ncbi:g8525 [Coccomyxa elongata]
MAIFQIYGGSANDEVAAFGNGLTLAVIIYATANVSGGHVNPAVTLANCLTGHMSWGRGGLYMAAQLLGAIFGALIESGLLPDVAVGGGSGPGCFTHLKGIHTTTGQLWWWETIMTFLLVSVVYATAVTKPGHGNMAPLAIGFTLFASAFVGGPSTGAALNPARVLGPAMVFHCYWDTAFVYVFAEFFGAAIAAALVLPLYGFGQFGSLFDTRVFSWLGLSVPRHLAEFGSLFDTRLFSWLGLSVPPYLAEASQLPQHYQVVASAASPQSMSPAVLQPTPGAVTIDIRSKSSPITMNPAPIPQKIDKRPAGKNADAIGAAANFVAEFGAPVPPPKPTKPSLAALAQAEKLRPHHSATRVSSPGEPTLQPWTPGRPPL